MENDNSVLTDEQLAKFQEIAKKRRDSRAGIISKYLWNNIALPLLPMLTFRRLIWPHYTLIWPIMVNFISTCSILFSIFGHLL